MTLDIDGNSGNATTHGIPTRTRELVEAERLACLFNGFQPIEVKPGAKGKLRKGWPETRGLPKWLVAYSSTGLLCESLRVLDFDIDDAETAQVVVSIAAQILPLDQAIIRSRENSVRMIFVFRAQRRIASDAWPGKRVFKLTKGGGAIEALGAGQQFVAFGPHPSGVPYLWLQGSPLDRPRDSLPIVTEAELDALSSALDEAGLLLKATGGHRSPARPLDAATNAPFLDADDQPIPQGLGLKSTRADNFSAGVADDQLTVAQAVVIFEEMPNSYPVGHPLRLDYGCWRNLSFACHAVLRGEEKSTGTNDSAKEERLYRAFEEFSARYDEAGGKPQDAEKLWDTTRDPREITAGTLVHFAQERIPNFGQRGFISGEDDD